MARRDAARERHWRRLIERQARSGVSARAFCEERGLSAWTFYGWRQELRRRDGQRGARPKFVAVEIESDPRPAWPIEITVNGVVVRVAGGADRRLVAEVIAGLRGAAAC